MSARNGPEPPQHLSRRAKAWWRSVLEAYDLGDHHLHLLRLAAESLDRAEDARLALAEHGTIFTDRFTDFLTAFLPPLETYRSSQPAPAPLQRMAPARPN